MRPARRPRHTPYPRHLLAALASAGLVIVLHGWLLSSLAGAPPPARGAAPAPLRSVQVRQIAPRAAEPRPVAPVEGPPQRTAAPGGAPAPAHTPTPPPTPTPTRIPPPMRYRLPAASPHTAAPAPARLRAPAPQGEVAAQANGQAAAQPTEVPVYATRLPPAATLHYGLSRGAANGSAVLRWSPEAGRYTLSLHGQLAGAPGVAWASHGTLDAHGIAPERYTESRRGRELRAANFQRDSARITFSGPQIEHPLPPGAQDRLSWMLQLGAVLGADPTLETPGRQVLLFVVGSRGDAEVWTFIVHGRETIELPDAGGVESVLLRREPRLPYDTRVEIWLDPARHHLPVRAHLTLGAVRTQFVLEQLTLP